MVVEDVRERWDNGRVTEWRLCRRRGGVVFLWEGGGGGEGENKIRKGFGVET